MPGWAGGKEMAIGLQNAPELAELGEEELVVTLGTGVLQNLIGVDFIEGVVLKRQSNLHQVKNYVRVVVRVDVQGGGVVKDDGAIYGQPLGALGAAANDQFALHFPSFVGNGLYNLS
jgi:hypothetical protein